MSGHCSAGSTQCQQAIRVQQWAVSACCVKLAPSMSAAAMGQLHKALGRALQRQWCPGAAVQAAGKTQKLSGRQCVEFWQQGVVLRMQRSATCLAPRPRSHSPGRKTPPDSSALASTAQLWRMGAACSVTTVQADTEDPPVQLSVWLRSVVKHASGLLRDAARLQTCLQSVQQRACFLALGRRGALQLHAALAYSSVTECEACLAHEGSQPACFLQM